MDPNPLLNLPLPSVGGFLTAESRGKRTGRLSSESVHLLKLCLGHWHKASLSLPVSPMIPDST